MPGERTAGGEWAQEVDGGEASPEPVWPPRIPDPRQLPMAPDTSLGLAELFDPGPLPEPDFTPGRLAKQAEALPGAPLARVDPGAKPAAVVYDRRNPSGRTRGDKVLRPTDADREERMRRMSFQAMWTACLVVGGVTLVLAKLPLLGWAGVFLGAAMAGRCAHGLGDSEQSWALSLGSVGLLLGVNYGMVGALISVCLLSGAGWITGMVRAARVD